MAESASCWDGRKSRNSIIPARSFILPDIQAAYDKLKANEVLFKDEPHLIAKMPTHDLWMAFFRDSEGNLLALMSEVDH